MAKPKGKGALYDSTPIDNYKLLVPTKGQSQSYKPAVKATLRLRSAETISPSSPVEAVRKLC